jgi:hypothetical protein
MGEPPVSVCVSNYDHRIYKEVAVDPLTSCVIFSIFAGITCILAPDEFTRLQGP